jgi:hypothetical protein
MIALTSADSLQAYTQHLQDYQSRYRRLDNRFEISAWIAWILGKFEQYGFTNCSYQEYELQGVTQRNVIATIPGSVNPDTYVLIGAHYDSITNSQPMVFAPGADDNASGTAGLLEMARIMKAANFQPDCSIRFIAISAEEGLGWGSDHYCQTAIAEGQDIRLMLNMNMIACSEEAAGEFLIHPYEGFLYHCDEAVRISELYSVYQPAYGSFNGTSDSIRDTQSPVSIDVYNLKGQRVMRLYQGEIKEETELIWDGKDFRGRACASGIYFLRAKQSGHIVTRKVLLLKTP